MLTDYLLELVRLFTEIVSTLVVYAAVAMLIAALGMGLYRNLRRLTGSAG